MHDNSPQYIYYSEFHVLYIRHVCIYYLPKLEEKWTSSEYKYIENSTNWNNPDLIQYSLYYTWNIAY